MQPNPGKVVRYQTGKSCGEWPVAAYYEDGSYRIVAVCTTPTGAKTRLEIERRKLARENKDND